MTRGRLIVVEGLDRSGKTTQCQLLCQHIESNGGRVKYIKFPDRTTATGQMINAYLQGKSSQNDQAVHLLFSANRWEAVASMIADIEDGCTLVVDRYSFSGAVYSAAKEIPNLTLTWAWNMEVGLPRPDHVFFFDISPEDAAKRGEYGQERYEKEEMQARVKMLFVQLFDKLNDLNIKTINAGGTVGEVSRNVRQLYNTASQNKIGELRQLSYLDP